MTPTDGANDARTTSAPGLRAALTLRRGDFALDIALDAAPGEVIALLGPNGAGKTTTLRILAGLLRADTADVVLDGVVLDGAGGRLGPEARGIGVVFQDYLLFPHLSLLENVAFGLRARGVAKAEARRRAAEWLRRVGLSGRAGAKPGEISGGQAQRVALARALVTEPSLLLLDEPLAALDAGTRIRLRAELRRDLRAFTGVAIVVTHDLVDAMVLADRIVVLTDGGVVQSGTPRQVTREPRTQYVANLVGMNLFTGLARKNRLSIGHSKVSARTDLDGQVLITLPPSAVTVAPGKPDDARNSFAARVVGVEEHPDAVRLRLSPLDPDEGLELFSDVPLAVLTGGGDPADDGAGSETGEPDGALDWMELGAAVWVSVDATRLHAYAY